MEGQIKLFWQYPDRCLIIVGIEINTKELDIPYLAILTILPRIEKGR